MNQFLAPNGKPSNLTPEQYKLVRTPAFKKWFGDWENLALTKINDSGIDEISLKRLADGVSKVVDSNGEPLVVYHGSKSFDINEFDLSKSKRKSSGLKEFGTYFTDNLKLAIAYQNWSELKPEEEKEIDIQILKWQKILEKSRNNRDYEKAEEQIKLLKKSKKGKIYEVFLNLKKMEVFNAKGQINIEAWNNLELKASYKWAKNRDAMDFLKEGKFGVEKVDGIKAENIVDAFVQTEDLKKELLGNAYLVFDSKNIKLADGSNTTFDGNNPDIRYEKGGLIAPNGKPSGLYFTEIYNLVRTKEFKNWFGDWEEAYKTKDYDGVSKIIDENGEPLICVHNTPNEFYEFDEYEIGKNTDAGYYGKGFYFTPNVGQSRYGEIELNCFLNIKNPYFKQSSYRTYELNSDELKNQSYDGVVVYPIWIENMSFENGVDGSEEIVAYYPQQIKLGDGRNTTFDNYNPDIRYAEGGKTFNDKELLAKWENGESIGFTAIAHLKSKGLIPRADGNKRKSEKYMEKGGEIIINPTEIECHKCHWSWNVKDGGDDLFICHKCNYDNSKYYKFEGLKGEKILDTISYDKGGRTIAQTSAPKKDRIYGSENNKPESSKDISSAKQIKFSDELIETIKNKVNSHNKKYPNKQITIESAKAVVRRGMGAYSKSHRPTIKGGNPNSRVAWGLARLNAFLYKIVNGKSKSGKYSQDNDLIEELGYDVEKYEIGGETDETTEFWGTEAGGALVYCSTTDRYLILLRSDWVLEPNTWGIISGKLDVDETNVEDAVLREAKEETGQELSDLIPSFIFEKPNFKFHNFVSIVKEEFTPKLNWENSDYRWVKLDEMPENLHFGLKLLLQKEDLPTLVEKNKNIINKNQMDKNSFNTPLLIRLFELMREEVKSDVALHEIVENIIDIRNKGTLTMSDYDSIVGNVLNSEDNQNIEVVEEEKMAEGGKVESIHSNKGDVKISLDENWYSDDTDVELVPVSELIKFREFDRKVTPKYNKENSVDNINHLKFMFQKDGVKSPLIIEYSDEDKAVLIIEGNHRLNSAIDLGMEYLPARVVLKKYGKYSPEKLKNAMKVSGVKGDQYGYIPSNMKPSKVGIAGTMPIYAEGGIIEGRLHSECGDDGCGRKFQVGENGHVIEAERDEAVIVADAFESNEELTIKGTPSEVASALNVLGGGKNFDKGAEIIKNGQELEIPELKKQAVDTDVDDIIDPSSIIINRRSMADEKEYEVTGTPKQIASAINSINGNGVVIEQGAEIK